VKDWVASVNHFVRCAEKGASKSASQGEQAAFRLGKLLKDHIGDFASIDTSAAEGFAKMAQAASSGGTAPVQTLLRRIK